MKKMKKLIKISPLFIVLLITSCSNQTKITNPRGKVKLESIYLSGKVPGRVEKIWIKEGDFVHKGDTLISLDIPEINAKLQQAQGAVQAAKAQLRMAYNGATIEQVQQIDGKLEAAQAQLAFAQESYNRIKNMYQDSLVPPQKFDEVKMKLQMAQAQVNAIKAKQKEVLKGTRKEVIEQAKGQLKRALGALQEVQAAAAEKYLIAPQDIQVETISLQQGELATPGYAIVSGYLPKEIYFRFTVPESKIQKYKVNQQIDVENPYTQQVIKSRIIAIKQLPRYADITSPSESYKLSESVYELKVKPEETLKEPLYQNAVVLIK